MNSFLSNYYEHSHTPSPGLAEQFRVPHNQSTQGVLAAARAFAAAAQPHAGEFVKRGLPRNFLEDLQADIDALEEADALKLQGRESHVSATAAIDDLIERGMQAARELDPLMRNTYADDAPNLAAWMSACRVERSPRPNRPRADAPPASAPAPVAPGPTGG